LDVPLDWVLGRAGNLKKLRLLAEHDLFGRLFRFSAWKGWGLEEMFSENRFWVVDLSMFAFTYRVSNSSGACEPDFCQKK